jgi:hypothetical protein
MRRVHPQAAVELALLQRGRRRAGRARLPVVEVAAVQRRTLEIKAERDEAARTPRVRLERAVLEQRLAVRAGAAGHTGVVCAGLAVARVGEAW